MVAFGQTKYLNPEANSAFGISAGVAKANANSKSYGFSLGNRAKEWLEFGCGLSTGEIRNEDSPKESYTSISPYIQLIGMRDHKKPISASLTLFYLGYLTSSEPMPKKTFGFDGALFRDISIGQSSMWNFAIVPEFGFSKVIIFDKGYENTNVTTSGQISFLFNYQKKVMLLVSPSISKNRGNVAKAIAGGIIFTRE
jgi:hypothetical protein